jgi:hypothetical protein
MNTSHEQALARLMGEDLYVWSAQPEFGDGVGFGNGIGRSVISCGDTPPVLLGCGYGEASGIGRGDGPYPGFGGEHDGYSLPLL